MWLIAAAMFKRYGLILVAAIAIMGATAFGLYWTYSLGSTNGKAEVQALWNKDIEQRTKVINDLLAKIQVAEFDNRVLNKRIDDDLVQSRKELAIALNAANTEYTTRLRLSESRASTYKRMSESGTSERTDLANHAAELDRSLEEGRSLVRELRETLGQRDKELTALTERIKNDQRLFQ